MSNAALILGPSDTLALSLQSAITTTNPTYVISYVDHATQTPGAAAGSFNGTGPVNALSGASAGYRLVTRIDVHNEDTVGARAIAKVSGRRVSTRYLQPGEDCEMLSPLPYTPNGDMTKAVYDPDNNGVIAVAGEVVGQGDAATMNIGLAPGTVAGGDALASEISRATNAEALKADLVDGAVPVEQLPDSALLAIGESASTAYRGDRGKVAYDYVGLLKALATAGYLKLAADGTPSIDTRTLIGGASAWGGTVADNLNTLTLTGPYTFYGTGAVSPATPATGAPFASSGHLWHSNSNVGTVSAAQMAISYAADPLLTWRTKVGSVWQAWSTPVKASEIGFLSGVTSAIQPQLDAKADLAGGEVPTSQLPDRALRTAINYPLRVAVFGDSTALPILTNTETNVETISPPFPESGTTTVTFELSYTVGGLGPYNLVANGAWGGQTTRKMLDRSKNAVYSTTRKSIQDVIALRPHIVILHGGSINNINTATAYSSSLVATSISEHLQIVRSFTSAGIYVLDSGILGYSEAGAYLAVRRQMLLEINAGIAAAWATESNLFWHWIEPSGLMHDGTGAFLTGYSTDGTHLTTAGNYALGCAENVVINRLFLPLLPSAPIYDQMPDFLNASAGIPAKTGRDPGTATINSSTCTADLYTVNFTTSASTSFLVYVAGTDLKAMLTGALSGDRYAIEVTSWVENTDGTLHGTAYGRGYITFRNADNAKAILTNWWFHNSGKKLWLTFTLPCDAADLGTSSNLALAAIVIPTIGTYNFKMRPFRMFKI